ncbi:MAG TPA: hypothetical protein PK246_08090 [Saprospiraceae bacterium]|nr:hypothetical protein [Lewinellaceae bacterium]HPK10276.1 hypothetical protein [Saprospiraceae bacterium]
MLKLEDFKNFGFSRQEMYQLVGGRQWNTSYKSIVGGVSSPWYKDSGTDNVGSNNTTVLEGPDAGDQYTDTAP